MVKLEKLTLEEINKEPAYIDQILSLYDGDISGEFYKYNYKGQVRWLYKLDGYCTILCNDGEDVLYTSFFVNNADYSLGYMEFDEFYVGADNDEELIWKEGDKISESLRTLNRSEQANNDGYTGLVVHHQRNSETGEEILITYQNQYREDGQIFACNLVRPFIVSFINGKKVTQYLNFKTNCDYFSYDAITIKEYGLSEFLRRGAYALQGDYEIRRYFKVQYQKQDGTCVLGVPIFRGYKEEEMFKMIEDKGFRLEVPGYVLDYYNGNYEECAEYRELAEAIKVYDLEHREEKKLAKTGE